MRKPTKSDWIKLAAFIDGEGTILIKPVYAKSGRYTQLCIGISNTDPRLPVWLLETFGGAVYVINWNKRQSAKWRRAYTWKVHSQVAGRILEQCLPHFLLKREQAEVAIAYRKTFRYRTGHGSQQLLTGEDLAIREHCAVELKRLKKLEPPVPQELVRSADKRRSTARTEAFDGYIPTDTETIQ
jgi:hypothetical protein